jgi:hypothetical protein
MRNRAGFRSVSQWFGSADPDPYQYVTDPELFIIRHPMWVLPLSFHGGNLTQLLLSSHQFSKLRIFINSVIQDMILQYLKQDPDSRSRTQHNTDEIQNEYEISGIQYKLLVIASRFFH